MCATPVTFRQLRHLTKHPTLVRKLVLVATGPRGGEPSQDPKVAQLARCGITVVERVPHAFPANAHNERYLRTKAVRSGHLL